MNHALLRERIINKPLLVSPAYAEVVVSVLADKIGLEPMVSEDAAQRYVRPAYSTRVLEDGIAVMPIVGSMVHRGGYLDAASGVQSYTDLHSKLTSLLDDKKVRGILLDMDTPGGECAGITELGDWIKQARSEKPIWALANSSMCSAGYWLGSAATKIIAAPMSHVGSIGVVVMHTDVSKAMEKRGIAHTFIHSGAKKVEGNPYEPLPESVRASIQASIDTLYDQFVTTVADNRGLDPEAVRNTEAGVFDPKQALELGLVDRIGGLGETLTAFAGELSQRTIWSASRGIYMDKEYTKDDLAAARAAAAAEASEKVVKMNADFAAAVLTAFPGKKAEAFAAVLQDGGTVALASKMAALVEEPKPVAAAPEGNGGAKKSDFDRKMEAASPGVSPDDAVAGPLSEEDRRAARLAQLKSAATAVRAGKYGLNG